MPHFDEPTYVFDFRSTLNCTKTEMAKPGETITVLVRPEGEPHAPAVSAQGTRSADGESFEVSATTDAGMQKHTWMWEVLMNAIQVHRGKSGAPER